MPRRHSIIPEQLPPLEVNPDAASPYYTPEPEHKGLPKWMMGSLIASQVGDNLSTNLSGGEEINPLLPKNKLGNMAVQGAVTAGSAYLLNKLHKKHPKIAKALSFGLTGLGAYDTASNLKFAATGKPLAIFPFERNK